MISLISEDRKCKIESNRRISVFIETKNGNKKGLCEKSNESSPRKIREKVGLPG